VVAGVFNHLILEALLEHQQTLAAPIAFTGVGLHTGAPVNLRVLPAPTNTGIVFQRVDLDDFRIEAVAKNVAHVAYATTLMKQGVLISTVEHLLSSLYIFGIDNALVELDNLEVPILDGSALEFVREIQRVGIDKQPARRTYLVIRKELHLEERNKTISIFPSDSFHISYSIEFSHPLIQKQTFEFEASPACFAREIAPARTFGFLHEVEELRKNGLVRGGSLDNAIVLTKTGILNDILRFRDEFVRHKILDNIGDLSLIGRPFIGRLVASKAGHALHTLLVTRILNDPSNFELMHYNEWVSDKAEPKRERKARTPALA
jgi:UDP-3-O-[3-hydroxymyristoyl] N-acetylglucosamine deacetylase